MTSCNAWDLLYRPWVCVIGPVWNYMSASNTDTGNASVLHYWGEPGDRIIQFIQILIIVNLIAWGFVWWKTNIWPFIKDIWGNLVTFFTQNTYVWVFSHIALTIFIQTDKSRQKNIIDELIFYTNIPIIGYIAIHIPNYTHKWWYNRKVSANQLKATAKRKPTPEPKSLEWYDARFLIATLCYGVFTCITTWYINYIFDLVGPLPIVWLWRYKSNTIRDNYPRCLGGDQESRHKRYDEYNFWLKSGYKLWWWMFSSRFIITFALHTHEPYPYWKSGHTSVPSESTMLCQFFADSLISTTICDVIWCVVLYGIHVAYMQKSDWVRDWVQWKCPIIWTDNYGLSDNYWPPANDASDYTKLIMQFQTKKWWNLNHDKSKTTNDWLLYMIGVRMIFTCFFKYFSE